MLIHMVLEEPSSLAYKSSLGTKDLEPRSVYSTTVQEPALEILNWAKLLWEHSHEAKWNKCVESFRIQVLTERVTKKDSSETQDLY